MPTLRALRTSAYAVSALCALTLLGACGSEKSEPGAGMGSSSMSPSTGVPSSSSTPSGTPSASGSPAMPPSGRARPTSMSGQVSSTEGGCVVFTSDRDSRRWVLVGETEGLRAGTAYVVDGVAMDAMDPRCPQALPFHVTRATMSMTVEELTPLPSATRSAGAVVRLTGLVTSGVEAGCRVLQTPEGTFVLSGAVDVADGTRVTVSGVKRLDWASTCQEGPVLEVVSLTPTETPTAP